MTQDRFIESQRFTVMHEVGACAHAPERRGANTCARDRSPILNNEISGPNVVEQEIAERMDRLRARASGTWNAPPLIGWHRFAVVIEGT
jgi:hypothetical protein